MMKYEDFNIVEIDSGSRSDCGDFEEWLIEVKKTFPSKNQAKKYLHHMIQNQPVAKIPKSENCYEVNRLTSAECSLDNIRDLIHAGFELRSKNDNIVAEGHATMTISEDGESILTRIEAFD